MRTIAITVLGIVVIAAGIFGYVEFHNGSVSYAPTKAAEAESVPQTTNASSNYFDLETVMAPRALGNPDAPVKIEEYASLTCSHCATFHTSTFPKLKEEFIDTGRVYFVFNDYPLNAPALDAAILARCVPENYYFNFIKLLFDTQADWAYESGYKDILRSHAKLLGLGGDVIEACMTNKELRSQVYDKIRKSGNEVGIKSTPSFIINGELAVTGAKPIDAFRVKIKKAEKDAEKSTE